MVFKVGIQIYKKRCIEIEASDSEIKVELRPEVDIILLASVSS